MRFKLPSGVVVETETVEEMQQMLAVLGVSQPQGTSSGGPQPPPGNQQSPNPPPASQQPPQPPAGRWSEADAEKFASALAEGSRKLLELLIAESEMGTQAIADHFGFADRRPVGGLLGPINGKARKLRLPTPVRTKVAESGEKLLFIDSDFQAAARRARERA